MRTIRVGSRSSGKVASTACSSSTAAAAVRTGSAKVLLAIDNASGGCGFMRLSATRNRFHISGLPLNQHTNNRVCMASTRPLSWMLYPCGPVSIAPTNSR